MSFKPNWASPPGDTIKDILEEKSITKEILAKELAIETAFCEKLLIGDEKITESIAEKLSMFLGASKQFWINRESDYRKDLKRLKRKLKMKK